MKAKEFIIEAKKGRRDKRHSIKPKAPNPVAKHAMSTIGGGGFGAHKDKKKEQKQGYEKHKGQGVAEGSTGVSVRKWANQVRKDHGADVKFFNRKEGGGAVDSVIAKNIQGETVGVYNRKTGYPTVFEPKQGVAEVSQQTLQSYRKKAAKQKSDALDVADRPDTDDATWVKNMNIASKRKDGIAAANKRLGVAEGSPIVVMPRADRLKKPEEPKVRYQGDIIPPTKPPSTEKRGVKGRPGQRPMPTYKEQGVAERIRDPEDWDEGNTEPGNNFAIYINGKKWKVFPGPYGAYADSPEEEREFYRLKDMARRKSEQTGKKWEVYKTGEPATK